MLGDYSLSDVRARMSPSFSDAVIIFPGKKCPFNGGLFQIGINAIAEPLEPQTQRVEVELSRHASISERHAYQVLQRLIEVQ